MRFAKKIARVSPCTRSLSGIEAKKTMGKLSNKLGLLNPVKMLYNNCRSQCSVIGKTKTAVLLFRCAPAWAYRNAK